MKKCILLVVCCLYLCGCGNKQEKINNNKNTTNKKVNKQTLSCMLFEQPTDNKDNSEPLYSFTNTIIINNCENGNVVNGTIEIEQFDSNANLILNLKKEFENENWDCNLINSYDLKCKANLTFKEKLTCEFQKEKLTNEGYACSIKGTNE